MICMQFVISDNAALNKDERSYDDMQEFSCGLFPMIQ